MPHPIILGNTIKDLKNRHRVINVKKYWGRVNKGPKIDILLHSLITGWTVSDCLLQLIANVNLKWVVCFRLQGNIFDICLNIFTIQLWHIQNFKKVISHKNVVKNHLHYNINMGLSFVNNKKILKLKIMDHVELCIKIWIILLTSFCF